MTITDPPEQVIDPSTSQVAATPVRLTRSRRKGSRLESPNGLPIVSVTRPGKWGNPFRADVFGLPTALALYREMVLGGWSPGIVRHLSAKLSTDAYRLQRQWRDNFRRRWSGSSYEAMRVELRGVNLACWCPAGQPCHADVLLELANGGDAK